MADNTEQEREFKGVWFPKSVWLDTRLTAIEKIILLEVDSLSNGSGCYASNDYLAEFCQCSRAKVTQAISKLKKLGYIRVVSFNGRNRVLESCLLENSSLPTRKNDSAYQKVAGCLPESSRPIYSENTSREYIEEDITQAAKSDTGTSPTAYSEIIDYLNAKTGRSFKATSKPTQRLINARLKDGYSVEDFKRVIDNKCSEWLGDQKFQQYLQPSTLFAASHFDNYLNQTPQPTFRSQYEDVEYEVLKGDLTYADGTPFAV